MADIRVVLNDFYTAEDLSFAKFQLIKDIDSMDSSLNRPHVSQRRDGDGRLQREVDDLISLFTYLDEHKLIDLLPKYVTDDPDALPPVRIHDSDFNGITMLIKRLTERVDEYATTLTSLSHELKALQVRQTPVIAENRPTGSHCDQHNTMNNDYMDQWPPMRQPTQGNLQTTANIETIGRPDWFDVLI